MGANAGSKKKGLGRGLGALFDDDAARVNKTIEPHTTDISSSISSSNDKPSSGKLMMKISMIVPNSKQPRKVFRDEDMKELIESVRTYGIIQPLVVRKDGSIYSLVAGERRWRAAQAAGLKEVPVVLLEDRSDQETMEIALIENIQRSDLNPIEEAEAYKELMDNYNLSQEEVAKRVSKNRSTITNTLRLLKLTPEVRMMVANGTLSEGHARALLSIEDSTLQQKLANEIATEKLSVRETEKRVKALSKPDSGKKPKEEEREDAGVKIYFKKCEEELRDRFGTKVHINRKDKNKGRIEIEYYSGAELERILDLLK